MTIEYKCSTCDDAKLKLVEDAYVCESKDCEVSLSIDEATERFEDGKLIALVESSEAEHIAEEKEAVVADLSEDISALVEGAGFSDEFAMKAKVIMESAISVKVKEQTELLEAKASEYAAYVQEQTEKELSESIDDYLDVVVEAWVKENEIALEAAAKSELDENLVEGLAELLKGHYVQAPQERWDIVEGLSKKVEELESKLDEAVSETVCTQKELGESTKAIAILKMQEGLAETQKEKLIELAESIDEKDAVVFVEKLEVLKESYFKAAPKAEKLEEAAPVVEKDAMNEALAKTLKLLSR